MKEELKPYVAQKDISVVEAMTQLGKNARGILFIVDEEERLEGCITDGDIRRWLIKTADLQAKAGSFMFRQPRFLFKGDGVDPEKFMAKLSIGAVPYVDADRKILEIKFRNYLTEEEKTNTGTGLKSVPVVIMAGGKGTRLYPYTKILPKPLIPIGDTPILERIVNRFVDNGVEQFFFTVNYKKSMIKSYFEELQAAYKVEYVEEDQPLGTGGSLRLIKEEFTKPLFITNCDILIQADLTEVYRHHLESGNAMTIVASLKNTVIPYGVINVKERGLVENMQEKPCLSHFINTGMYVINPELIKLIPENTFYHMPQLAEEAMARGEQVGIFPISEDAFLDMGQFEEMKRMEEKLKL